MAVLPMKCRRYLTERGVAFEEVVEGDQKAIVLRDFGLPVGRFETTIADILILLPSGYPDSPPDMFYVSPWLRLVSSNQYPKAADQPITFQGKNWQRWSRHNNEWRHGVDGIWTTLKRVETALEVAA